MIKMTAEDKKRFEELVQDFMIDYGITREVAEDMAYDQYRGK